MNQKSGSGTRKPRQSTAKRASKKSKRVSRAATAPADKYASVAAALASADAKELAALLLKLTQGERRVPPGVTLSAFEAGFLAGQLSLFVGPRRRHKALDGDDHFLVFPSAA